MTFSPPLFEEILSEGLAQWSILLSGKQLSQMSKFAQLIVAKNKQLNLTRLVGTEEMAVKNFLDSLGLLRSALPSQLKCLDLGTGAGFPGVPLAIARPQWTWLLLDSRRKRLDFLEQAAALLGLENVQTLHVRAEEAGRTVEHREGYELVTIRAVARLPVVVELGGPLLSEGGLLAAFKGKDAHLELVESAKALQELGLETEQSILLQLPLKMGERQVILLRKKRSTPGAYPRRAGIPQKRPLV